MKIPCDKCGGKGTIDVRACDECGGTEWTGFSTDGECLCQACWGKRLTREEINDL
jgi:RecJ-like exonuclease